MMASVYDAVKCSPKDEILIVGNLKKKRESQFQLINTGRMEFAYKIKATSPDDIRLNPGYGYLKPMGKSNIIISVGVMKARTRLPKHEHVSVLLIEAPSDHPKNPTKVWKDRVLKKHFNHVHKVRLNLKFAESEKQKSEKSVTEDCVEHSFSEKGETLTTQSGSSNSEEAEESKEEGGIEESETDE